MRSLGNLPIMPKETKTPVATHQSNTAPYPAANTSAPRSAAIWTAADDEILMQARASGLNWQPIASRHFPSKTANACRKRHERLIERRQVEDWDGQKLENLALEYLAVRKEMWELLASRVGERWSVVEAKCMEKGLKNLQAAARAGQRKGTMADRTGLAEDRGNIVDRNSDSGIGFGSDAEMEVDDTVGHIKRGSSSWHAPQSTQHSQHQEHSRSRSLPQPLPLYQPPPPLNTQQRRVFTGPVSASPATMTYPERPRELSRYSPDFQNGRGGISIQAMLSPAEPMR